MPHVIRSGQIVRAEYAADWSNSGVYEINDEGYLVIKDAELANRVKDATENNIYVVITIEIPGYRFVPNTNCRTEPPPSA
jgi:hypothetical protein